MSPGARTTPEGTVASSRRVVSVDLAPTGAGCPPPLVSSTAMHAGAFRNDDGMVNVSVQVVTPVPTITLPAELDPMMLAPAPQSAPSAGAANAVPGPSRRIAPARTRAVRKALVLRTLGCMILLLG